MITIASLFRSAEITLDDIGLIQESLQAASCNPANDAEKQKRIHALLTLFANILQDD